MIAEFNIAIEGTELNCDITYSRYRDNVSDEAQIDIESVICGDINVMELITTQEFEKLKDKCERDHGKRQFEWIIEREQLF